MKRKINRYLAGALLLSDPLLPRQGYFLREFSDWEGILNSLYYKQIHLDPRSAEIKDYIFKLTDGVRGDSKDFPGNFLLFDGPLAKINVELATWSELHELQFRTVEIAAKSQPQVSVTCRGSSRLPTPALLRKNTVEQKGQLLITEYRATWPLTCRGPATLTLSYEHRPYSFAFIDELVINGLSLGRKPDVEATPKQLSDWQKSWGDAEKNRLKKVLNSKISDRDLLLALMGQASSSFTPRLAFWAKESHEKFTLHPFMLQVDATGNPALDLLRGFYFVPQLSTKGAVPLAILNQQGSTYGSLETAGFLGREEMAWAADLAGQGVAVLALDSILFNQLTSPKPMWLEGRALYNFHPQWSVSGKESANLRAALDFVLSKKGETLSGTRVDQKYIAAAGFSYGALNSLIFSLTDKRVSILAMSHLEDYSKNWLDFAQALYIPQLSFLTPQPFPLHVCRLLQESSARQILASVGDAGLAQHYQECLTKADSARIQILHNPIGKVLTFAERQAFLDFLLNAFNKPLLARTTAPSSSFTAPPQSVIERDNAWRSVVLDAMKKP